MIDRKAEVHKMQIMKRTRKQELSEKAHLERLRCRDWLIPLMKDNRPKLATKDELRSVAMRELNVSKLSFDFAWIAAIEDTGRHDWYEPLRVKKRLQTHN